MIRGGPRSTTPSNDDEDDDEDEESFDDEEGGGDGGGTIDDADARLRPRISSTRNAPYLIKCI